MVTDEGRSPREIFLEGCRAGELRYQVGADGAAFFYPRVLAPRDGSVPEWRVSSGRGVVYSTTTVRVSPEESYNVSLIDLEEGFRMMSTVRGIESDDVRIDMPVSVDFAVVDDSGDVLPIFIPAEDAR